MTSLLALMLSLVGGRDSRGLREHHAEGARALQRAARRLPVVDRVPVLCAVVRELLTDATSDACVRLDIAVREACEKRHPTTEGHRETAREFVAEVLG